MSRPLVLVLCTALPCFGCSAVAPPGHRPADLNNDSFERALVDAHNAVRARVAPVPAAALTPMRWDDSVAAVAQQWAEGCVFDHRQPNDYGENLALFSDSAVTPAAVVELWAAEAGDYNYDANSCKAGAQCGHYTQVVWRDSTRVGCGVAICDDVAGFGAGALWVCNYDPPGNFIGDRPY